MSAPTPPPPASPAAKGSKTVLWIVLGAGGCLLAIAVTFLVIGVLTGLAFRRRIAEQQHQVTSMNVRMEEDQLALYLESDPDRLDKVRKVWDELRKQADAGELKEDEAQRLSDEVRKVTADGQVTSDEADEAIAMGAKIAGVEP
jgi:uncharacterized membrane protein YhiD involved in acid resistance